MNKKMMLTGKFVIGFEDGRHVVYEEGQVVYEGDKIIFVGHDYSGEVDETLDSGLSIISPGFIDLEADIDTDHANFDVVLFKKVCEEKDFWMPGDDFKTRDPYSDSDFYIRQKYSMAQLIMNGITTAVPIEGEQFQGWSQSYNEFAIMADTAQEMGLRVYLGPSFKSKPDRGFDIDQERQDRSLSDAFRFFEDYDGKNDGMIKGFVNPCQISITEPEILKMALKFAEDKNAPMRLHSCEDDFDWSFMLERYGKTPIDTFEELGLLSPNLMIPHAITLKNNEIKKLADNNVSVIQTPIAEVNYGAALFSFSKYKHYGVNMTIGTDAQPTDMIQNMRLSWDLDRLAEWRLFHSKYSEDNKMTDMFSFEPDYPRTTAEDFFNAATINGAKALKRNDLGKLEAGAKADIIVIDIDDLRVGPYEDPLRTLLVSCVGNNVKHTIINGQFKMKDKELIGIDEKSLMKDAQKVYEKYLGLFEKFDKYHRPLSEFCPPSLHVYKK